jgi:hypothetical protein
LKQDLMLVRKVPELFHSAWLGTVWYISSPELKNILSTEALSRFLWQEGEEQKVPFVKFHLCSVQMEWKEVRADISYP